MSENQDQYSLYGKGIYSVPEASRLTGVSAQRLIRWLKGYDYKYKNRIRRSSAVWERELPIVDGRVALSFRDLIEVRFINAFLERGVSWPVIRKAADRAAEFLGSTHPFSTHGFLTDGRSIFADLASEEDGEPVLLDLARSQYAFKKVLEKSLYEGLEFDVDQDAVARWWPLGFKRNVVLDPDRSFGQPIISKCNIPTRILANAVRADESIDAIAKWYNIPRRYVVDAVEFENQAA